MGPGNHLNCCFLVKSCYPHFVGSDFHLKQFGAFYRLESFYLSFQTKSFYLGSVRKRYIKCWILFTKKFKYYLATLLMGNWIKRNFKI